MRKPDAREALRGLSNGHIKPLGCHLTLAKQGSLIKATRPFTGAIYNHPGVRGEVQPFSRATKRRMVYKLASINREYRPDFVTLTYPGRYEGDVKSVKRDLNVFGKRLARLDACAIWRLEFKERKTGASVGEIVPHFHFFVWWLDGGSLDDHRQWLARSWYEVVGSGQESHLKACENCQTMRSWNGVMYYAAKYITKDVVGKIPEHCGRQWGWINEDRIPWSEVETEEITVDQCKTAFQIFESYAGSIWREECPSRTLLNETPEKVRAAILSVKSGLELD